ncbi:hypothetical protein BaRGS_00014636 [Batillaria attramentaria]|uniref:Uncharacterized protein n=1 Tax=Batillaria attramentaria TaxID=370345 RepID=A0ABD0L4M3_9CAEN
MITQITHTGTFAMVPLSFESVWGPGQRLTAGVTESELLSDRLRAFELQIRFTGKYIMAYSEYHSKVARQMTWSKLFKIGDSESSARWRRLEKTAIAFADY